MRSSRSSGTTSSADSPARRTMSWIGEARLSARSATWRGSRRSVALADRGLAEPDGLLVDRGDQARRHAVGGAQPEFCRASLEDVDRARIGAGELHRLGDDGRQHGFEIERRVDRLADLAKRLQLLRPSARAPRFARCSSSSRRVFSMAMTAWSAKVRSSAICFSDSGPGETRTTLSAPIAASPRSIGMIVTAR